MVQPLQQASNPALKVYFPSVLSFICLGWVSSWCKSILTSTLQCNVAPIDVMDLLVRTALTTPSGSVDAHPL